jgi:hypothetical protein
MALEPVQGQTTSLTNEREYLRQDLTAERQARVEAEIRAAAAEAQDLGY